MLLTNTHTHTHTHTEGISVSHNCLLPYAPGVSTHTTHFLVVLQDKKPHVPLEVAQCIEGICLAHTYQKMLIDCNQLVSHLQPSIPCRQSLGENPLDNNGKVAPRGGPRPTDDADSEATPLRIHAKFNLDQSGKGMELYNEDCTCR